jgi:LysW-gamma-L-lysine carboxypeptidase
MAHTAGPDPGVATVGVDFWNHLSALAGAYNSDRPKPFDQLLPSLRTLNTMTDEAMWDHVQARAGLRLPLDYDVNALMRDLARWAATVTDLDAEELIAQLPDSPQACSLDAQGASRTVTVEFSAFEAAWRSDRNNLLVRSFLAAIRQVAPGTRPGFVVKTGTSDMNVVGPSWRCPILAYGPGDSRLDHTPHEHLPLDEYWQAILVLEEALRELAGRLIAA